MHVGVSINIKKSCCIRVGPRYGIKENHAPIADRDFYALVQRNLVSCQTWVLHNQHLQFKCKTIFTPRSLNAMERLDDLYFLRRYFGITKKQMPPILWQTESLQRLQHKYKSSQVKQHTSSTKNFRIFITVKANNKSGIARILSRGVRVHEMKHNHYINTL